MSTPVICVSEFATLSPDPHRRDLGASHFDGLGGEGMEEGMHSGGEEGGGGERRAVLGLSGGEEGRDAVAGTKEMERGSEKGMVCASSTVSGRVLTRTEVTGVGTVLGAVRFGFTPLSGSNGFEFRPLTGLRLLSSSD
jgi:hypothetical protein